MTAGECLATARAAGPAYQRVIKAFVDDFRRAGPVSRRSMVQEPLSSAGCLEGLTAAVVSALCRETGTETPDWVGETGSPEPFFPFPAESFEMRLRLMIDRPRRSGSAVFRTGELPVESVSAGKPKVEPVRCASMLK